MAGFLKGKKYGKKSEDYSIVADDYLRIRMPHIDRHSTYVLGQGHGCCCH